MPRRHQPEYCGTNTPHLWPRLMRSPRSRGPASRAGRGHCRRRNAMTITKARQDRLGAPAMDADERKALELQVENGSARMKKIVWNARGYTHFLTASDG